MPHFKKCFKCGKKRAIESGFYKHPGMADGHLNKCIECTKQDVTDRQRAQPEKRAAYERKRWREPKRRKTVLANMKRYRKRNKKKVNARTAVYRAVKAGKIVKMPCSCGSTKVEAHHDDYDKPLDVKWLCKRCHEKGHHA